MVDSVSAPVPGTNSGISVAGNAVRSLRLGLLEPSIESAGPSKSASTAFVVFTVNGFAYDSEISRPQMALRFKEAGGGAKINCAP